jgi:hypothetical protein
MHVNCTPMVPRLGQLGNPSTTASMVEGALTSSSPSIGAIDGGDEETENNSINSRNWSRSAARDQLRELIEFREALLAFTGRESYLSGKTPGALVFDLSRPR